MAGGRMQKARFNGVVFANFSDDILFTIFLKLPVKSVLRCRCVCKSWRQSLCDLHFIKMHINRTNHEPHHNLLLISSFNSFYSIDLETSNAKLVPRNILSNSTFDTRIIGSCNGLLCLTALRKKQPSRYVKLLKLVLWNPSTGDYKKLPAVAPLLQNRHVVGFGYDSSLDDYKMVRIILSDPDNRVDMYSLKANSWKIIGELPDHSKFIKYCEPGLCLNGSIYWMGNHNIICFDFKNDKFREVQWLHDMNHQCSNRGLSAIGGYLGFYRFGLKGEFVVWELKEDCNNKEEWVKLMTIPAKTFAHMIQPSMYKPIQPVCFLENGKVLFSIVERIRNIKTCEGMCPKVRSIVVVKFVVYDPKMSSTLETFPIQGIRGNYLECATHKESLVSPNFA